MERLREGSEPKLAANLIVSQFVLPPHVGPIGGPSPANSREAA